MEDTLCYDFARIARDDIDDIDITNVYAFTWTPDPVKYPSGSPRRQYKMLLNWILLTAFKYFDKFVFIPELNKNGNVHIHGWYLLRDKIAYYKHFLPRCKQLGWVLVKDKVNDGWFEYLEKELDQTIEILGNDLPIPLTHFNCRNYRDMFKKVKLKHLPTKLTIIDMFNKYK